ncbi:acyl-CoA dehydrogenase [Rhodovulum sp. DZ06]|uniref:acyl-CoA dehydrogenase n=1 Tax=Rhodovulum sp. DZ06 TaxID=3425126 RepID=UPI003D334A96
MPNIARLEDLEFILDDMLGLDELLARPRYAEHDRDTIRAMMETALKLAEEKFQPHAAKADANEPHFDGERVHMIPEVQEALGAYVENGFTTMGFAAELGGMQLPLSVASSIRTVFASANIATLAYVGLTAGAAGMLNAHGSQELKDRYLQKLIDGTYFGTMCLSEPQAGSSLADITTRAEPQADGTYRLTGRKMWISGGEHELTPNIVHFVLAKIPGGPAGVKGISLFCVPKVLPDGTRNEVQLMGLNHKMGYRGTTNCALAFGEKDGAVGWLVGPEHEGLACMFHMMNEARIGVGAGAAALGYAGYLHALDYARERPQGRPLDGRDPTAPMIPIIEHPDVRRQLLRAKAYAEGAVALCISSARLVDDMRSADPETAEKAELLLDVLTPIIKSWPSDWALEANDIAIQVHGGYGYTRDYPVERLYRDNRLNPIHEGTKGIQGLDLLGRKVRQKNGACYAALMEAIGATVAEAAQDAALADMATDLQKAAERATATTKALMQAMGTEGAAPALANAAVYLDMLGHVTVAWIWLRQAVAARKALAAGDAARADMLQGKIAAARFFFVQDLPMIHTQCDLLDRVDRTALECEAAWF